MTNSLRRSQLNYKQPVVRAYCIFVILGCVLGVLSGLNIARKFITVELAGWLDALVSSYRYVVRRIMEFLFGWIDLWWMNVTELESHVIVLSVVTLVVIANAPINNLESAGVAPIPQVRIWTIYLFSLFFIFIVMLPIILLPDWWGTAIAILNLGLLAIATFWKWH